MPSLQTEKFTEMYPSSGKQTIPGNKKIGNGYSKLLPLPDIHTIENPGSLIADSLMKPGHSNPHPVVIG